MKQTRTCSRCGGEFEVNVHPVTVCGHCECDERNQGLRRAKALHALFARTKRPEWIKLNQHGLEAISVLYWKGGAECPPQDRRTPEEEAFFLKFCELWDYREYCNRTRDGRWHGWWFRLQQRIKFWILNHLE